MSTCSKTRRAEVVALPGHTSPALAPQGAVLQNGFAFRNSRPWQVSAAVNDHLPNQNHGPCRYARSQNDRINGRASPQRDRNSEPLGCQGEIHSNLGSGVIFVGTATPIIFASGRMVHQTESFWDDLGVQVLCLVGRKLWLCKTRNKEFLNEQIDQNDRNCLELLTWK